MGRNPGIVALLEGARMMVDHLRAGAWKTAALRTARAWVEARTPDYPGPPVHMGLRVEPGWMTFNWSVLTRRKEDDHNVILFNLTGHWIHALAYAHAATGERKFRDRAEAMIAYLCGANPWRVRLFNETGGVYNWVEDTDGDGREDWLKQDMYPESTAFCQIGILHLLQFLAAGDWYGIPPCPSR